MATATLASWAANLEYASLPESVCDAARRSLYNYMGCAIHGVSHPTVRKAYQALQPFFGAPAAHLLGTRRQTDAQHAALLNGIASHVHDYDDTHLATIIHPAGPVASALLAYAEHIGSVKGHDLIVALVAGIEAECKLGLSVWPSHYDVGWHITSTTGAIGAAVAVGRLMRLEPPAMAHAIGLAAVQVVGLREMFGSDTKSFHPGRAAQAGILAAVLAAQGFTSSEKALEAKRGWANVVVAGGTPRLEHFLAELGQVWEIERNTFKPFPCGIVKHPAIDAAIRLHQQLGKDGDVSKVLASLRFVAQVHPLVIELTSKSAPRDGLEAKFSVKHGIAVGLLFGKAGPAQYTDECVRDQFVVTVRDTVSTESRSDLAADEALIRAESKDGVKVAEVHVAHAIGSLAAPMDDQALKQKFEDQVSLTLEGEATKEAGWLAWNIAESSNVSQSLSRLAMWEGPFE